MTRIPVRARHALAVACALLMAACGSDGGAAATAGGAQDAFPGPGAGLMQASAPVAPQGGYPQGQPAQEQSPQNPHAQGQYAPDPYAQSAYPQGQYPQGHQPQQHSPAQAFSGAHAAQPTAYPDPYAAQARYSGVDPVMPQQAGQGPAPHQPSQQELEWRYPEAESQAQRDHQSIIDSIRSENGLR